jgi:hypothetical protein
MTTTGTFHERARLGIDTGTIKLAALRVSTGIARIAHNWANAGPCIRRG